MIAQCKSRIRITSSHVSPHLHPTAADALRHMAKSRFIHGESVALPGAITTPPLKVLFGIAGSTRCTAGSCHPAFTKAMCTLYTAPCKKSATLFVAGSPAIAALCRYCRRLAPALCLACCAPAPNPGYPYKFPAAVSSDI